jgi:3-oxoacyl-(acyl-carrier-protein) synthase
MKVGKIVITGYGLLGPCGNNVAEFWKNFVGGVACIEANPGRIPYVGFINKQNFENDIPQRLLRKCARFSKISLCAISEASKQAKLNFIDNPDKIGIFVGNNTAGWDSANLGLHALRDGFPVSPYMASNWFPAAVQGHASLLFNIKGISKTIVGENVSGIIALKSAIRYLKTGQLDVAIVGGVETPVDDWGLRFYSALNEYTKIGSNDDAIISEGAAFIIIETEKHAVKRLGSEKCILSEIINPNFNFFGGSSKKIATKCYQKVISNAIGEQNKIDTVFISETYSPNGDYIEYQAIQNDFSIIPDLVCPKKLFGNTIAASAIIDLILATVCINKDYQMETIKFNKELQKFETIGNEKNKIQNSILILSKGYGGVMGAVKINKYNQKLYERVR